MQSPFHDIPESCWDDPRFVRLIAFAEDVLAVCEIVGLDPVMDGGLALQVHLGGGRAPFAVRDVDFGCPEADFLPLERGLREAGIFCEIQPWHVLQVRRDDLKVEFGAEETWNTGITGPYERVRIGRFVVRMMHRAGLREQYRRGVEATAGDPDPAQMTKHAANAAKLAVLDVT